MSAQSALNQAPPQDKTEPRPAEEAGAEGYAPGFAAKLNFATDSVVVMCVLVISAWLAAGDVGAGVGTWILTGVALVTWLVGGTVLCLYDGSSADRSLFDDIALHSVLIVVTTLVVFVVRPLIPDHEMLPSLSYFAPILWPVVVLLRLFVFRPLSVKERPADEVLILGVGPMGRLTGEELTARHRRKIVGYVKLPGETPAEDLKAPVLGSVEELERIFCTVAVDAVYISGKITKHAPQMQAAIKLCERFGIPFALPAYPFRLDRARPTATSAVKDGYLHFVTFAPKPHQMATKRLLDITMSGLGLLVLSPLLVAVALAIKLTSRGPVFFRQQRIGMHGKPFGMLKFRSMVVNAEALKDSLASANEMSGPVFKMKNDPRVTRVGRFIRRYSIDELPQLFNVLRGEMSLVGPRPPVPKEVAKYASWQRRRLSVRPGLTCFWQVSGRNEISFEEWMYMDMKYIDNWSLKDDIMLILRTVPAVVSGHGAS
jgi:exopolysaccharide biosynthesis polyprenyl glycosylphosphotransferase